MREKLLINDIHIGVQRVAGTTPASSFALCQYLIDSLSALLGKHEDKDVVINGDLFDTFSVPLIWLLGLYHVLRGWLKLTALNLAGYGPKLVIGRGNHDWSKDSSKLSSFDVLCQILKAEFPDRVVVVTEPQWLERDIYMIPHMPNQDLFNLALDKALTEIDGNPVRGPAVLLLHANYDNNFAIDADHSLNVLQEQAKALIAKGWTLVFGHEHQARSALGGDVIITGNQWPSSVADCLNNPGGKKFAHVIKPWLRDDLVFEPVPTWDAAGDFAELDWRDLAGVTADRRFVRVIGDATAEEAPAMLQALAKFRQQSDAFVITNAVKIAGVGDMEEITTSVEEMKAFDVIGYLLEQLDERQQAVVRALLKSEQREQQLEAA